MQILNFNSKINKILINCIANNNNNNHLFFRISNKFKLHLNQLTNKLILPIIYSKYLINNNNNSNNNNNLINSNKCNHNFSNHLIILTIIIIYKINHLILSLCIKIKHSNKTLISELTNNTSFANH